MSWCTGYFSMALLTEHFRSNLYIIARLNSAMTMVFIPFLLRSRYTRSRFQGIKKSKINQTKNLHKYRNRNIIGSPNASKAKLFNKRLIFSLNLQHHQFITIRYAFDWMFYWQLINKVVNNKQKRACQWRLATVEVSVASSGRLPQICGGSSGKRQSHHVSWQISMSSALTAVINEAIVIVLLLVDCLSYCLVQLD